jgi:hypothetical protein
VAAAAAGRKKVQTQQRIGSWSAPFTTDVVAIHAAVLNTGQVLMWYSDEPFGSGTGSRAELGVRPALERKISRRGDEPSE